METTIIGYLGQGLMLLSLITAAVPVFLLIVSEIWLFLWNYIDDGESKSSCLVKKLLPFLWGVEAIPVKTGSVWVIKSRSGLFYDARDRHFYGSKFDNVNFKSREDCLEDIKKLKKEFMWSTLAVVILGLFFLGLGLKLAPIITFYIAASAGTVYSLKWTRRGYKKIHKLKETFVAHTKDKKAHE